MEECLTNMDCPEETYSVDGKFEFVRYPYTTDTNKSFTCNSSLIYSYPTESSLMDDVDMSTEPTEFDKLLKDCKNRKIKPDW